MYLCLLNDISSLIENQKVYFNLSLVCKYRPIRSNQIKNLQYKYKRNKLYFVNFDKIENELIKFLKKEDLDYLIFSKKVLQKLKNGKREIRICPKIQNPIWFGNKRMIVANKLLNNKKYGIERKICYKIGELINELKLTHYWCQTTPIWFKCYRYTRCKSPVINRLIPKDEYCACENTHFWNHFSHFDDYSSDAFANLPWDCKIGVRFSFKNEPQIHNLKNKMLKKCNSK